MSADINKYSYDLRELTDDYYNHRIDIKYYREQRKQILDKVDEELNGMAQNDDQIESENRLNKMLGSFNKNEKEVLPE